MFLSASSWVQPLWTGAAVVSAIVFLTCAYIIGRVLLAYDRHGTPTSQKLAHQFKIREEIHRHEENVQVIRCQQEFLLAELEAQKEVVIGMQTAPQDKVDNAIRSLRKLSEQYRLPYNVRGMQQSTGLTAPSGP